MTATDPTAATVEVMWRPGCPYCGSLRRGLRRAGVVTTDHDIWASATAAARVREATGGDETVPTVFVGGRALVNPSARQVIEALRAADPDHVLGATPSRGRARVAGAQTVLSAGPLTTIVVAVLWSALAVWRPTTTWHLAPLILAAAWPWVLSQETPAIGLSTRQRIVLAGVGGLGAAVALTGVLAWAGRLRGPTITGSGTAVIEALILAVCGAAIATTTGLRRAVRRTGPQDPGQLV